MILNIHYTDLNIIKNEEVKAAEVFGELSVFDIDSIIYSPCNSFHSQCAHNGLNKCQ